MTDDVRFRAAPTKKAKHRVFIKTDTFTTFEEFTKALIEVQRTENIPPAALVWPYEGGLFRKSGIEIRWGY